MEKPKANCFCQVQTNKVGSDSAAMVFTDRAIDCGRKASSLLAAVTKPSCVCKLQPFVPSAHPSWRSANELRARAAVAMGRKELDGLYLF